MAFYIEDLYKKVIQEPAEYFNYLKVVSGYASAGFLKKVIADFPDHKVTLIVGMAPLGISVKNHEEFKKICTSFPKIKVFYQTETPPTHMKIYQWYFGESPGVSFIGSANFSEAGFLGQNEILSPMIDIFSTLIEDILSRSVFCLDEEVLSRIPLFEDIESIKSSSEEFISRKPVNYDMLLLNRNYDDNVFKSKEKKTHNKVNLKKMLLNNLRLTPYNHITVELMLKDDPHWESKALNVWTRPHNTKSDSYINIERTNKLGETKWDFFSRNADIQVISDDDTQWIVRRAGEYGKELKVIEGISFYEYFSHRLGITEERSLSYKDFYNYGRTNVDFYKLNENQYLLDFSLNTYKDN